MIAPPVSSGNRFIFYGLLKQGAAGAPAHLDFPRHGEFLGPRRFAGRMLDLGGFPGVVPGEGACHGVLYRLDNAALAPEMDAFEDIKPDDPEGSLYRREKTDIIDDSGRPTGETAWIYIYNQSTNGYPVLEDGNWPLEKGRPRK
ncbi:gamma-glutamylcyclotransferase family protein [Henriciella aquimarina]|uniref:gamma-glutamylcyclotransferase family protein n=1 Tax=Henriciella aquimarina TaxID=545261 RepID=UPI000A024277|nr:gamma-glutamylcyclotransferase family protein [Henriciella aquimarina]